MSALDYFEIPESNMVMILKQHREWGSIKCPESLRTGLTPDQERDLKIILEDRRVTDLSAHYWMKLDETEMACGGGGGEMKNDTIIDAVKTKLDERAERGLAKYGVSMDLADLTEARWLQHAQEELLDGAIYLEKLIQKNRKDGCSRYASEAYDLKDRVIKAEIHLERLGYRHCDIPACNCNGYHIHTPPIPEIK